MRISPLNRLAAAIIGIALFASLGTHAPAQETPASTPTPLPSTDSSPATKTAPPPATSAAIAPAEQTFRESIRNDFPLTPDKLREASIAPPMSWQAASDFTKRMNIANGQWSGRFTEIAKLLEKTGITLKQTSQPGVWIITSPRTAVTQPAIAVRLFPEDASPEQMRWFQQQIPAGISINFAMRFFTGADNNYPPGEQVPGTGETDDETLFLPRELLAQTGQALAALPSVKPLRKPSPIENTPRTRQLRTLLKDLKAQKVVADARWQNFLAAGDNTPPSSRHRANTWEEFCSKLGEVIEDTEKELRGELPAPATAP